jgi:HD superfamily phosphohydrolase
MKEKIKILNDPVHGFIQMPSGIGFEIVNHPWFQRLRNIKQLGISHYVYPGATHTRFQHSLGAYFLTKQALNVLTEKGIEITNEEREATLLAIILHDIGHSPFSHTLENVLFKKINHEELTRAFICFYNKLFNNKLDLTLKIFDNKYKKLFLHQLISSQLDMDRLDYLKRDSFYTGVLEGVISTERIIKMLNVSNNSLVVEEKGIYSIEKFLISRRLMYWQVYLHKTVLASELMLIAIFKRAYELFKENKINLPENLKILWVKNWTKKDLYSNETLLQTFAQIDDSDIIVWLKQWANHNDFVLSTLCQKLINRQLFKIKMLKNPIDQNIVDKCLKKIKKMYSLSDKEAKYFIFHDFAENRAYSINDYRINILFKNGKIMDIAEASDILNIDILSKKVIKYYFCTIPECFNI